MSENSLAIGGRTAVIPWDQKLSTIHPKPLTTNSIHWNLVKENYVSTNQ